MSSSESYKRMKRNLLLLLLLTALHAAAQIQIWKGTCEKAPQVTLTPYLPEGKTVGRTAVIVCPGGSYHWLDMQTEGIEVAQWLNRNGIAAFVLRYRVAGVWAYISHYRLLFRGHRQPDMLRDVQRSIQLVRQNAAQWGIDAEKIGVMGFSAGGHLAMASAVFSGTNFLAPLGIRPQVTLRPNFVVPLYPVVTLADKRWVHKRSRKGILGEWGKYNRRMRDSLSLERHIPAGCPPVFLVNCEDDPIVKYGNSLLLDSALTAKGITHRYLLYKTGGHGFGASDTKGTPECRQWRQAFLDWLKETGF